MWFSTNYISYILITGKIQKSECRFNLHPLFFMLIPGLPTLYQAEEISSPPVDSQSVPEAFHRLYSPSGISVGSQL